MRRLLALAALVLGSGCALTTVQGSWVAPEQKPPMGRTLVVGLSREETWARSFEEQMSMRLRSAGVEATPLSAVEQDGLRTQSADEALKSVDAIVAREGFDAVLVGYLGGPSVEAEPYIGYSPWWGWAWGPWWGPGYYGYGSYGAYGPAWTVIPTWRVETRLFETAGGRKLVWSMVATTEDDPLSALHDIGNEAMERLSRVGLIPLVKTTDSS